MNDKLSEPPHQEPTDKDFMAAHIETLLAEKAALEQRVEGVDLLLKYPFHSADCRCKQWGGQIDPENCGQCRAREALAEEECKHPNAVSAKNEVISGGMYCPDCGALLAEEEA